MKKALFITAGIITFGGIGFVLLAAAITLFHQLSLFVAVPLAIWLMCVVYWAVNA